MPKIIYTNHSKGLSVFDRQGNDSSYAEGREVDIYRDFGYVTPGCLPTVLTKSDAQTQIIRQEIKDICVNPNSTNGEVYFLGTSGDLYQINNMTTEAFNNNFDGSNHYYKAITSASSTHKLIIYNSLLLYAYNTSTKAYLGSYDLSSTFADTYKELQASGPSNYHPMVIWNENLWIGCGRYVAKLATATLTAQALDLGVGWEITSLFTSNNYIGICAFRSAGGNISRNNECRIFLWDGVSTTFSYSILVDDNFVTASRSNNGDIFIWSYGRDSVPAMYQLNGTGLTKLRRLKTNIAGSSKSMTELFDNAVDVFGNRVLMSSEYLIWSYGSNDNESSVGFSIPWGYSSTPTDRSLCLKVVSQNKIYMGYTANLNVTPIYQILKFATGTNYSTRATFRENYIDFGQRIGINYIKFYFRPLVSGDSITVGLDIDYGTSVTLKDNADASTITYASDGTITSKKFMVGRDCHAFRPTISWTAGGVAISRIVVDYDFLPNDN